MKNNAVETNSYNSINNIKQCLNKIGCYINLDLYDGILVKKLANSNVPTQNKTKKNSHTTDIKFTGEQVSFFPYVCRDTSYSSNSGKNCSSENIYAVAIEVIFNQDNFNYLTNSNTQQYAFKNNELKSYTCVWKAHKSNQDDQIGMSLKNSDDEAFTAFRDYLQVGDYLIILKRKKQLVYEFYGVREVDGRDFFKNDKSKTYSVCLYLTEEKTLVHSSKISYENLQPTIPYNYILFGAPGNGKSYKVNKIVKSHIHFRTTFHAELDYNGFVGVYKPITNNSKAIEYKFTPKIFLKAYVEAWKNHKTRNPVYLVIEEINRGNCSLIFGDIFQLLDRDINGYSIYPIDVDDDIRTYLKESFESLNDDVKNDYINSISNLSKVDKFDYGKIAFPNNFFIISTMNTSDQSLFPVDSAFRRRFSWKYVPINYDEIKDYTLECDGLKYSYKEILEKLNNKIKLVTDSEDKQIGQRFIELENNSKIITAEDFINKICLSVWNDVFKDEGESDNNFFCKKVNEKLSSISFNELAIKNSLLNEIFKFNDIGLIQSKSNVTVEKKSETQISDQNSTNDDVASE